jgi:cytochrome P450
MHRTAPQPATLDGFSDQIAFFTANVSRLGPLFQFPMFAGLPGYLVATADGADRVLRTHAEHYPKGALWAAVGRITGNGLSTNQDHESWKRQRRLMNPAFARPSVQQYVEGMQAAMQPILEEWAASTGAAINLTEACAELTQAVILKILFGTSITHEERLRVGRSLVTALTEIARLQQLGDPTAPLSAEADAAIAYLDTIIERLATDYRSRMARGQLPEQHLMGQLIAASDEQGVMDARQLRDELMVSFLAGYETTALSLQWTLYLLSQHPAVEARLLEELGQLGGRPPTVEELRQLPYVAAVRNEVMRLYPPVPYIPRQAAADDVIEGFHIPAGALIFVGAWHLQRDPALWGEHAAHFRLERWLDAAPVPHRGAFIPFSTGGRVCIGQYLAETELDLALIAVLQRFRFVRTAREEIKPFAVFTLRPTPDIFMALESR